MAKFRRVHIWKIILNFALKYLLLHQLIIYNQHFIIIKLAENPGAY